MYSQYQKAITGIAIQDRTTIGQYLSIPKKSLHQSFLKSRE